MSCRIQPNIPWNQEFIITLGPVCFLRVGRVWSLDLTDRFGLWGIGLKRIGWRRING